MADLEASWVEICGKALTGTKKVRNDTVPTIFKGELQVESHTPVRTLNRWLRRAMKKRGEP